MRAHDEDMAHVLKVVDQALDGEPVAPADAELAELTLLLAGERPRLGAQFATELDARAAGGFAAASDPTPAASDGSRRPWWRARLRLLAPGAGLALAGLAVAVIIVGGQSTPHRFASDLSLTSSSSASVASSSASGAQAQSTSSASTPTRVPSRVAPAAASGSAPPNAAPGRQVIQGASLELSTPVGTVEDVARQVFTVIAAQNGVVQSSNVTATDGPGGGAHFSLTVPSANLGSAMADLSRLRGASVLSRNDVSQDVTGRAGGEGRRLADARGLRTALLRKLALATTSAAVDSLRLQIRDADASIASDLATLVQLEHQVAESHIELTITAVTPTSHPSSSGLTLGRAVHDAGRMLVVVAGVALMALAVLVPVGLLLGLGLWLVCAARRHRRDRVLDLV